MTTDRSSFATDPHVPIARFVLALAAVYATAVLWTRRSYVPIWDGRIYADCIVAAAVKPLTVEGLRCAGHPSHAYVALLALGQQVAPGRFWPMLATNAVLLVLATLGFMRVLRALAPGAGQAPERSLVAAAFVVHPVVLASVVQPGLDFGAMVFLLWATAAAVERRPWWLAGFGLLAAFAKESGVLVYVLLAGVYVLTHVLPRPMPRELRNALLGAALGVVAGVGVTPAWPAGLFLGLTLGGAVFLVLRPRPLPGEWAPGAVARRLLGVWMLAIPPLAFVGYLAYRATLPSKAVLWMGESSGSVVRSVLVPQFGPTARSYLALALVLGFLWVPSAVLAADLAVGARRYLAGHPRRPTPELAPDALTLLSLAAVGSLYLLTRYVTFANARYLLPVYPLLLALLLPALVRLRVAPGARRAFLGVVAVLLAWSATRTVDPVSRALWGTFRVGQHALLRITSLTGECCGAGRDQLIYNLQFTAFDDLVRTALARVQPVARGRTVAVSRLADWYVVGPLDRASNRTLDPAVDTAAAPLVQAESLARAGGRAALPDSLWFLDLPNIDGAAALAGLAPLYDAAAADTVRASGYAMRVVTLARRGGIDSRASRADVALFPLLPSRGRGAVARSPR